MPNQRKYLLSLVLFACLIVAAAVLLGLKSPKDIDSIEHIHSAWYVEQGYVPYRDFYQHHNPLLWFLMAPVIRIFGETMVTFHILNSIFIILVLGIGVMVFLICRQLTDKLEACFVSLILLFSMDSFYKTVFELRPDVPMLLVGLLAVWFFILFVKSGSAVSICLSGLSLGISFLFLQKIIFLTFAVFVVLMFLIIKKKVNWKAFIYFTLPLMLPVSALLIYLIKTDLLHDYFLTNWLVNTAPSMYPFSIFKYMRFNEKQGFFWAAAAFSCLFSVIHKKTRIELKVLCFFALVIFLSLFTYKRPYLYYQFFAVSLLSIVCACAIVQAFDLFSASVVYRMIIILFLVFIPVFKLGREILKSENQAQLEKIEFVIKNTSPNDCVYSGRSEFNLFRQDLHYFWYSTQKGEGLYRYNKLTNNKYGDYDAYKLIAEKRPKFIANYKLDTNNPVIAENYKPTQFEGLYSRKD